jgi:hypothetical protein
MILEAVVTTRNLDGTTNVSPMGPTIGEDMLRFELRPFNTSQTFSNLKRTREGVLHVTDDVLVIAKSAIGKLDELPAMQKAARVNVEVISSACRWYEFEVDFIDETGPRMLLKCRTVAMTRQRDFWGFNRGKHAVLEAAILATRTDFLPAEEILDQFQRLDTMVKKTGGAEELEAFRILRDYVTPSQ